MVCSYNPVVGLYYDSGSSGSGLGWSSANSLCSDKGMRLPTLNETSAKTNGGIPHFTWHTWTSTAYDGFNHYYWESTLYDYDGDGGTNNYVRCVVSP